MRRMTLAVAGLVLFSGALPARALLVAPPPLGPQRIANVDAIVVGRVIAIEGKDVQAPAAPKSEKIAYRVAVVSVTEPIKGAANQKMIRLAFPAPPTDQPAGGIRRPIRRTSPNFEVGQDGMFFLTKHFQEPFFTAPMYYDFVSGQNPGFDLEVKQVKLILKWGNNPKAGLQSKDTDERYIAAAVLLQQYRQPQGRVIKSEAIDAAESKLILKAILEADWKQPQGNLHPWMIFNRLGLSNKDGWQFPQGQNLQQEDFYRAAKTWLEKNADTYRIQRFVSGPGGGPVRPPIRPLPVERDVRIQPEAQPGQAQPVQVPQIRVRRIVVPKR